jgi:ribonuclease R
MADDRPRDVLETQVLALLKNNGTTAYRPKEISKKLAITDHGTYQLFLDVLEGLVAAGKVVREKGGRVAFRPARRANETAGLLQVTAQGHGYVTAEDGASLFVPPGRLGTALDGDRVRVAVGAAPVGAAPGGGGKLREAEVLEVLERMRTSAVGTFEKMGHFAFVRPDDHRLPRDIYVDASAFNGATENDKVLVSIDAFDDPRGAPEGRVLEVLGPADDPNVAILALALAHGVRATFPEQVEREAEAISVEIPPEEVARRLDLRAKPVFTIDPFDAKDFDDAIHVLPLENGHFEVGVHIADVAFYVEEGGPIDAEAYRRGTSVYLVDRTIPMLPEKLSNGVCSLRPHEDKLAFSVIMEVTPRGIVKGYEIRDSVIYSYARLTYEEAQGVIDGAEHPMAEDVRRANELARVLTKKRLREGSIDFDLPEVKVVLDERGEPVEVIRKERKESNRLIEEYMLLANKVVAEHVGRRLKKPMVYRVHDVPNVEKITTLAEYVKAFGYYLPTEGGVVTREELNKMLLHFKGHPEALVVETAAIQSMAKAVYSPDNIGHFGLGFRHYSHFTSPIRRYPDLIAHRLLRAYAAGTDGPTADDLRRMCKHLSDREREAAEAERDSVKLKQVEYAAKHLGEVFDGVVVGVTKFGAFVQLTRLLVEGLVHVKEMEDDYWTYDPRLYVLVGANTRRVIRLGDQVRVQLVAASTALRRVDLRFWTGEEGGRRAPGGGWAARDERRGERRGGGGRGNPKGGAKAGAKGARRGRRH